jgi:O-antigen/teichoic acid export membrane protein
VTDEATRVRPRRRDTGLVIAVAMGIMNIATYGFQMVAARALGPQEYGAFAALMNLMLVVSVMSLAVQATAARRISTEPRDVAQIERIILRVTYRSAVVLGLVLLALTPVIDLVLRLESLASAAVVGVIAVPLTIMGGQAGVLQGERRWLPLAAVYVAAGVPRLVLGTALVLWHPSELTAVLGVALGAFVPVIVGYFALRRPRSDHTDREEPHIPSLLREVARSSQALLAFFALSNVDVIVARNVLDGHDAGLYAAGLIMTKAVLFLPQFVVVVTFPAMSTPRERSRALLRGLLMVGGIGVVATAGAYFLSPLAMVFVGGSQYSEIESRLWLFAVLGTLLAMLQLLVYAVLARQGRRSVYAPWAALVLVVVLGLGCDSLDSLLAVVVGVDALLLVVLLGISLYLARRPAPVPE